MTAPARNDSFLTANQHALATILEASQTKSIIASRDIFDIAGIKLWARDQPVSGALQRKLLDRQLRNPLESCLLAEDGVTSQTLVTCTEELLARDTPLSALLRSQALKVMPQVAHLPLHSVAQLLLTAGQASRADSFDHAVRAMALAGEAESPALKNALALALHLLGRLRAGWYSSGLWSTECVGVQNAAEADAMESELLFRLRSIERATRLRAGELAADEAQALDVLCQRLSGIDG